MKHKYDIVLNGKKVEREYNYIPVRYILAILLSVLEILAVITVVALMCYFVPYFYLAAWATEVFCVLKVISSDDNPEYKVSWLPVLLLLPIAGFMLYFLFYSRKLPSKYLKRLNTVLTDMHYDRNDCEEFSRLCEVSPLAAGQAQMLCNMADSHLYTAERVEYFPLGEDMFARLVQDLKVARRFIFMEYFIIEEGHFWNTILEVLTERAKSGVEVRVVYDDIGCMSTLPGNYDKMLLKRGISATSFSRLKGTADGEFNNRSHRKITVIDGRVGYTGGVNIADEYINERVRFGHWKDTAVRLEGAAVAELTKLFLIDYGVNVRDLPPTKQNYFAMSFAECTDSTSKLVTNDTPAATSAQGAGNISDTVGGAISNSDAPMNGVGGFIVPFGDGPRPLYGHRVAKELIKSLFNSAERYVYVTTPYLIIDHDLCSAIEAAAMRGVDVRLVTPHIPDKKLVFELTRSFYPRLMHSGVRIYEYKPGFIHAKTFVVDGRQAIVGTVNLDYRSLVHHFECGVWLHSSDCIADITADIEKTVSVSLQVNEEMIRVGLPRRLLRAVGRYFATLL